MLPRLIADRFELRRELGRGAAGVVFEAFDRELGRVVALKLLNALGSSDEALQLARFRREGELAARINHPGVVRLLATGEAEGRPFLAYEQVEGASPLDEALRVALLPRRVELVRDLARALGAAHEQGVVHRDVKPANVLVDLAGQVRITDFGVSFASDLERLTQSGALVGTATHMAPEQTRGESGLTPACDVWAVGVILYTALVGRSPFADVDSLPGLLHSIQEADYVRPREQSAETPRELEAICVRAMSADAAKRYADGEELALALDAWLVSQSATPGQAAPEPPRTSALRALAIGAVVVGGVFAGNEWSARADRQRAQASPSAAASPSPSRSPTGSPTSSPTRIDRLRAALAREKSAARQLALAEALLEAEQVAEGSALLEAAAESGSPSAMLALGRRRAAPDEAAARAWLSKALAEDVHAAGVDLAKLVEASNPKRAIGLLEDAARARVPEGIVELGRRYATGRGVEKDATKALAHFAHAVRLGDAEGMVELGGLYARGRGVEQDHARALGLYQRAFELGSLRGLHEVASATEFGRGLPSDPERAASLYRQAADRGYVESLTCLAYLHEAGKGVKKDLPRALDLYRSAATRGSMRAASNLGYLLRRDPSPAAQLEARRWLQRGADADHPRCLYLLGLCYRQGRGGAKDPVRAFACFKRAAARFPKARVELGVCYEFGRGVEKDLAKAARAYRLAGEAGDWTGFTNYSVMLEHGRGVKKDVPLALSRYREAAAANDSRAMVWLGLLRYKGKGLKKDRADAKRWFERAARRGDAKGKEFLERYFGAKGDEAKGDEAQSDEAKGDEPESDEPDPRREE